MKIKELKHNHSLTDLLKVLLFSILMLAPILAIGVKCGYVMLNKNANNNYSGQETAQTEYIRDNSSFENGKTYYFNSKSYTSLPSSLGSSNNRIYFDNVNVLANQTNIDISTLKSLGFYKESSSTIYYIYGYDENNSMLLNGIRGDTNNIVFSFNYVSNNLYSSVLTDTNFFYKSINISNNYLDNVFYYAIDEVAQEPLFNWTQNTAIYTGVNAMCTGMEITSPIIPILITYWFLLTCIYVIIDILIKGFTMLTHLIGSKLA